MNVSGAEWIRMAQDYAQGPGGGYTRCTPGDHPTARSIPRGEVVSPAAVESVYHARAVPCVECNRGEWSPASRLDGLQTAGLALEPTDRPAQVCRFIPGSPAGSVENGADIADDAGVRGQVAKAALQPGGRRVEQIRGDRRSLWSELFVLKRGDA